MYRSIFENAIEGIFQTTPSGQYLNVNPALAKMYGYDSTEDLVHGLTAIDNQLYVDPNRRNEFIRQMRAHGVVPAFESQIYRKDKSIIWISENARTVTGPDGKLLYYEGMVEDITERKRLETKLLESEEKISALISNIEDSIWSVDSDYRLITFNATFSRTFEEIFHKTVNVGDVLVEAIPQDWREEEIGFYNRALAGGAVPGRAVVRDAARPALLRNLVQPDPRLREHQRRRRLQQGHHRAATRAAGAPGGQGRGGGGQPHEERVPRQHEPRDPHADEPASSA